MIFSVLIKKRREPRRCLITLGGVNLCCRTVLVKAFFWVNTSAERVSLSRKYRDQVMLPSGTTQRLDPTVLPQGPTSKNHF